MPVCGNYLFFELPKKIVLNPKDGHQDLAGVLQCAGRQKNQLHDADRDRCGQP